MRGGGRETVTPLGFQARTSAWVSVRRSIEPEQSQGPLAKPDFARTGRDGHAFYWHRRIQGPAGRSCPATAESFFVARTDAGLAELIARLRNFGIAAAIAVEATGGFERIVAAGLASANLPVVIVNPAQVRDFTKALGKRTKTDPIDALVIARFVEATKPPLRPMPDEATQLLADLVARRRQIAQMIGAESQREKRARDKRLKKSTARSP